MGSSRAKRPKEKSDFSISIRFSSDYEWWGAFARNGLSKMIPWLKAKSYPAEEGQKFSYIILEAGRKTENS